METPYAAFIIVTNLASVLIACGVIIMIHKKSPATVKLPGFNMSRYLLTNQADKAQMGTGMVRKSLIEVLAG